MPITLRLRRSDKFGGQVAFVPADTGMRLNPLARDPIAEYLIAKVDRTRYPTGPA